MFYFFKITPISIYKKMGALIVQSPWTEYFDARAKIIRSLLLAKTVEEYGVTKGKALDIGAGPLVDTQYLLNKGFDVIAVEPEEAAVEHSLCIPEKAPFKLVTQDIREFNFPVAQFDLVSAQLML
jgi:16S rRNA A1518/A1519 N6-dimethyltransferase RsmA/KsgA/DIM1 with predicted DNA glycosylase/AP lyase activity